MVMRMIVCGPDPAHMMVVSRLRQAGIALVTDDLGAVFAELAIHRRLGFPNLSDAVAERTDHIGMVPKIKRLDKFDLGQMTGNYIGLRIDAFDQDPGKQK